MTSTNTDSTRREATLRLFRDSWASIAGNETTPGFHDRATLQALLEEAGVSAWPVEVPQADPNHPDHDPMLAVEWWLATVYSYLTIDRDESHVATPLVLLTSLSNAAYGIADAVRITLP